LVLSAGYVHGCPADEELSAVLESLRRQPRRWTGVTAWRWSL